MRSKRDFAIPVSLDIIYMSKTMSSLLRHPRSFARMFAGPGAIDEFIQEIYAKNPVRMKRTHGFEICLNPEDRGISPSIGVLGWYELRTTELFIEILRKGDTVVDVGANVGFFTLLAASIVGNGALCSHSSLNPQVSRCCQNQFGATTSPTSYSCKSACPR